MQAFLKSYNKESYNKDKFKIQFLNNENNENEEHYKILVVRDILIHPDYSVGQNGYCKIEIEVEKKHPVEDTKEDFLKWFRDYIMDIDIDFTIEKKSQNKFIIEIVFDYEDINVADTSNSLRSYIK